MFQQFLASTTHIVAQEAIHSYDAGVILFFRCSIASIALMIILTIQKRRWTFLEGIRGKDLAGLVTISLLNVPINQLLFLEGLRFTTPANSALLYALTPALVFLITFITQQERTSLWRFVGIILAFTGVLLVMFERGISFQNEYTLGNGLIFAAVVAWSLYSYIGKGLVEKFGAIRITALNMTLGTIAFIPIYPFLGEPSMMLEATRKVWLQVLYLGIGASVVNYLLWFYALGKLQTSKVAVFQNLQPVLTTTMSILLGKAVLTSVFLGGGFLTLIGVLLVQLF